MEPYEAFKTETLLWWLFLLFDFILIIIYF